MPDAFAARAAGAWFAKQFRSQADLGSTDARAQWWIDAGDKTQARTGQGNRPTIDPAEGIEGAGCMRLDIAAGPSPANSAGAWNVRFSPDDSIYCGPPGTAPYSEVWTQLAGKWSPELFDIVYEQSSGGQQQGIKLWEIATGYPRALGGSSSYTKSVILAMSGRAGMDQHARPLCVYGYHAGQNGYAWAEGSGAAQNFQSGRVCRYGQWADCWEPPRAGWFWLTLHERYLRLSPNFPNHMDFVCELFAQVDGGPRVQLLEYGPTTPGYVPKSAGDVLHGRQEFVAAKTVFPYLTEKSETQIHPAAVAWSDESIIGPRDPGVARAATFKRGNPVSITIYVPPGIDVKVIPGEPPPTTPPVTPPIVTPPVTPPVPPVTPPTKPGPILPEPDAAAKPLSDFAWRGNKPAGSVITIPGTAALSGICPPEWNNDVVDLWNGWAAFGDGRFAFAAAAGHGRAENPVVMIDVRGDAPTWQMIERGSSGDAVTLQRRYKDGRLCARHTYQSTQPLLPEHAPDGAARILLVGAYATQGTGFEAQGAYVGGPHVDAYLLGPRAWEAEPAWPDAPIKASRCSVCRDPRDGSVFYAGDYTIAQLAVKLKAWAKPWYAAGTRGNPGEPGNGRLDLQDLPSLIDVKRNRHIGITNGGQYYGPQVRLQRIDMTTKALDLLPLSGDLARGGLVAGSALVHDLDGDQYVYFGSGKAFSINPESGVSAVLFDFPMPVNGIQNRAGYIDGGIVFLPNFASQLHVYLTR